MSLRVLSRFAREYKGNVLKFRIQDVPKHLTADCSDFLTKYFVKEEPVQLASGIPNNPEAMKESREVTYSMLTDPSHRTLLCCLDTEHETVKDDFISACIVKLTSSDESKHEMKDYISKLKTKEMRKFNEIMLDLYNMFDVMEKYGENKYYEDRGGVVLPDYRHLGVSLELIKVIRQICETEGVPMVAAWTTSIGSQRGAARLGYETAFEVNTKELGERHNVTFENGPPTLKLMVDRINKIKTVSDMATQIKH